MLKLLSNKTIDWLMWGVTTAILGVTAVMAVKITNFEVRRTFLEEKNGYPGMVWSLTDQHEDFLAGTSLIQEPVKRKNKSGGFDCYRPAWPVTWNNNAVRIDRSTGSDTEECSDVDRKEFQPGIRLKIRSIDQLSFKGGEFRYSPYLSYSDSTPIGKDIKFHIRFNEKTSSVVVDPSSGLQCNIKIKDARIHSCDRSGSISLRIQTKEITVASIKPEGDVLLFESLSQSSSPWVNKIALDKKNPHVESIKMTCAQGGTEYRNMYALQYDGQDISIWCEQNSNIDPSLPEVTRLAALVQKVRLKDGTNLATTIDKEFNSVLENNLSAVECGAGCLKSAIVINALTGNIRAMAGKVDGNLGDKIDEWVTNFKLKHVGSVSKVFNAQAILAEIPELMHLKMYNFNASPCRFIDARTEKCSDDGKKKEYFVYTHGSHQTLDFVDYLAYSENIYAVALLGLGSTRPISETACRPGQYQLSGTSMMIKSEYGAEAAKIGQQRVKDWLANRYNVFTPAKESCRMLNETVAKPLWHDYMVKHMGAYNAADGGNYQRSYIWGENYSSVPSLSVLSPQRELGSIGSDQFNRNFLSGPYKWAYGGEGMNWSNLAVAEQFSAIVTKKHVKATLLKYSDNSSKFSDFEPAASNAANLIINGLAAVTTKGTAKSLCGSSSLICKPELSYTYIQSPLLGKLILLAKTGTVDSGADDQSTDKLSEMIELMKREAKRNLAPAEDWCLEWGGNKSKPVCNKFSRDGENELEIFKRKWNNYDKKDIEVAFQSWLTESRIMGERMSKAGYVKKVEDGISENERRIVFSLLKVGNDFNLAKPKFDSGCTFMFSADKMSSGYRNAHIDFVRKIMSSVEANPKVYQKACGF